MKNVTPILIVLLILSMKTSSAQLDPESNVFTFPVNKTVYKAFGITDLTTGQLVDFKIDETNELNDGSLIWFWIYVKSATPPIDFFGSTGLVGLEVYGPFSNEYLGAADSVQFGLREPMFVQTQPEGEPASQFAIPSLSQAGLYLISLNAYLKNTSLTIVPQVELLGAVKPEEVRDPPRPCTSCLDGKLPLPGKYLVSAWTRVENAPAGTTSYSGPSIKIKLGYTNGTTINHQIGVVGNVIDGWQLMEDEFEITSELNGFEIRLQCSTNACLFDDIRFLPFDASMKTYVYDAVNLRLLAELDERHYATLYEYDEEGRLRRIKKETERGRMTIQESSSATKK